MKSPNVGFYLGLGLALYLIPGISFITFFIVVTVGTLTAAAWRYLLFETALQHKAEAVAEGRAVLVTGTSSGFGKLFVHRLTSLGFTVYASVRKEADGEALVESLPASDRSKVHVIVMDVSDEKSVKTVAERVEKELSETKTELYAVVNNAGVFTVGPMELTSIAKIQKGLNVNVIGAMTVTNAFLPLLRKHQDDKKAGPAARIVFVGSIAGHTTNPYSGVYSATKHSVEAIADAYRLEVRGWGIQVSVLEPGGFSTNLFNTAGDDMSGFPPLDATREEMGGELYADAWTRGAKLGRKLQKGLRPATPVVNQLQKILLAKIPPYRALIGKDAVVLMMLHRIMPEQILYFIIPRAAALIPVD